MNAVILLCFIMTAVEMNIRPEVIVDWENYHIPYFDECVEETGVDPMIPRLMFRQVNLPDEEDFHCYMKCIFERNNWMTSDGEDINYETLAEAVHVTPELIETCRTVADLESEICRKVYLVTKCAVDDQIPSNDR
ncbi:uncharacterized protein LOC116172703 [Photinus pyralis]|uniref:uncharacterized protein LOC116172703 n=1 Tax=Photinus pyralis TaxID=7054 RepID=UPI0012670D9A|nr:uncharacterized protein LOC116172703 [Photinus pyralis]